MHYILGAGINCTVHCTSLLIGEGLRVRSESKIDARTEYTGKSAAHTYPLFQKTEEEIICSEEFSLHCSFAGESIDKIWDAYSFGMT